MDVVSTGEQSEEEDQQHEEDAKENKEETTIRHQKQEFEASSKEAQKKKKRRRTRQEPYSKRRGDEMGKSRSHVFGAFRKLYCDGVFGRCVLVFEICFAR